MKAYGVKPMYKKGQLILNLYIYSYLYLYVSQNKVFFRVGSFSIDTWLEWGVLSHLVDWNEAFLKLTNFAHIVFEVSSLK